MSLKEDGYLPLPGIVPRASVDAALHAINVWMGRGMPPAEMPIYGAQSYCPDDRLAPVFLDLLEKTPALEKCRSILEPFELGHRAQIALRFPLAPGTPKKPLGPHLDGIATSTNGVTPGTVHNFAALLGIYLSDVDEEWMGNFTVWPGSHLKYAAWFRERGPLSLLDGMPDVDLGPAKQLTGKAGDAFLCHYLLGHEAAENHSPHIRYAVFFRLKLERHAELGHAPMQDPWLGWR